MRAVERDKQKLEAIRAAQEQFTPTPAQSAYLSAMFAPGSGFIDAAGQFPEFPSSDVELIDAFSGEPMPSIAENIRAGGIDRYVFAPLQAVGAAGDVLYATSPFMANLPKGIATLGAVARAATKADKKGIKALRAEQIQQDINNFAKGLANTYKNLNFAKDSEGFVSPSLEALISKAPPNLQGKQITEWLSANANKGVKPKELEFLGIDEFIANNPNASVREVAEGVSGNQVMVTKDIRYDEGGSPLVSFDTTTVTKNPTDGSDLLKPILDDLDSEIADTFDVYEDNIDEINDSLSWLIDHANEISDTGQVDSVDDIVDLDGVVADYAMAVYKQDPTKVIRANVEGPYTVNLPENSYAVGNKENGFKIFVGGEEISTEAPIFSEAEAQIQLRNALEEGGDPLRIAGEADPLSGTTYKNFIDENLPGGNNYREITFNYENAPDTHQLTHSGLNPSGNYIAHALVRDRKLADGSTSLHVDELQSDLHQKGSRDGYRTQENEDLFKRKMQAKEEQLGEQVDRVKPIIEKYMSSYVPKINVEGNSYLINSAIPFSDATPEGVKKIVQQNIDRFYDNMKNTRGRVRETHFYDFLRFAEDNLGFSIADSDKFDNLLFAIRGANETGEKYLDLAPNYPYKDDWHAMSIKHLVKEAIDEGKDTISVSTSTAIKTRYTDQYEKFYETLYDQKIPSAMKKLANKYGGKFEKGSLDLEDTFGAPRTFYEDSPVSYSADEIAKANANIIRITPEMKQKILEEGLPSFALGGPVGNFIAPDDINIFA